MMYMKQIKQERRNKLSLNTIGICFCTFHSIQNQISSRFTVKKSGNLRCKHFLTHLTHTLRWSLGTAANPIKDADYKMPDFSLVTTLFHFIFMWLFHTSNYDVISLLWCFLFGNISYEILNVKSHWLAFAWYLDLERSMRSMIRQKIDLDCQGFYILHISGCYPVFR